MSTKAFSRRSVSRALTVASVVTLLSACVSYPDNYYGPDYADTGYSYSSGYGYDDGPPEPAPSSSYTYFGFGDFGGPSNWSHDGGWYHWHDDHWHAPDWRRHGGNVPNGHDAALGVPHTGIGVGEHRRASGAREGGGSIGAHPATNH